MIRTILRGALAAVVVALAACGGGSDTCVDVAGGNACSGGGGGGGGGTAVASDLVLVLGSASIANTGLGSVGVAVTALDANRNALADAPVTLSANNNAVVTLTDTGGVTNQSGVVSGTVAIGSDTSLRVITVTAVSGSVTRTATLNVVAGAGTKVPATVELLASATTVGTGGDTVQLTAFVKDANNNTLPQTPVTFTTTTGTLSNVAAATNASGAATASFSAGSDKSNRSATITVTSGAIVRDLTLPITGTRLTVSGTGSLTLGSSGTYNVTVVDSVGNSLPNVTVTAASQRGNTISPAQGVTDTSGQVSFLVSATAAGNDVISFNSAGATSSAALAVSGDNFAFVTPASNASVAIGQNQAVTVRYLVGGVAQVNALISFAATGGTLSGGNASASSSRTNGSGEASVNISSLSAGPVIVQATVGGATASATLPITFIATDPDKLVLQVAQTALAPNAAGTSNNKTLVIAKVTDVNDNPVQGAVVNFQRVTDPSGGSLQQASATTDSSGQATVTYVSGPESTASNGVVLSASVASEPAVSGSTTLTVNQTALFITLGTGNVINNADPQTYRKDWVVYVTDANGVAVSGVTLTVKAIPTHYLRGNLAPGQDFWAYQPTILICPTEDDNANGVLDPGEDENGDGVLWPGNVIAVSPGAVTTDSTGRATISLLYAESLAPWVRVKLTATARVSGTESRRDAEFIIEGSVPDFRIDNVPAGVNSPFGDDVPVPGGPGIGSCSVYL